MRARTTYVYVHLADGPVPAGRLDMIADGRNSHAIFQYGTRYLQRPDRVPVDPAALPLQEPDDEPYTFRTAQGFSVFNGIRDAAPDSWGQFLMHKLAGGENLDEFDYLVASADDRVGALAFGPDPIGGPKRMKPWGDNDIAGEHFELALLAQAMERAQTDEDLDEDLRRILQAGSSLGGARPKATTERGGVPWIAKFSRIDDNYPVCRTELAVMRLARDCGLDVPDVEFVTVLGRDLYLIKRFDRQLQGNRLIRIPFASALTMLEAHEIAAHRYSYRELADIIRRYGANPRRELKELFHRMVFNILVGNDDDHLRNHAFLFDGRNWRLSPLYDVVPKPRVGTEGSLVLAIGERRHEATLSNALTAAAYFGLKRDEAARLIEDLRAQVASRWRSSLREAGVGDRDIARLENSFTQSSLIDWLQSAL